MANFQIRNGDELFDEDGRLVGVRNPNGSETLFVTAQTDPVTGGGITSIWKGTQAAYDALGTYSDSTLYVIVP
jgi:hypothetical protein